MFQGSIVAIVTPMVAGVGVDTALDKVALDKLVEFHIEQGTDAIVAVGTTGESATLNHDEHCAVIKQVVKCSRGRVPVIAGTGANSTMEAIVLTQDAQKAGADACLLVTPYYNKPTQEGLFLHHQAVAKAVSIPQILYNVPGRTACDMLPETVGRLASIDNIIGVKEATGDISRVQELRKLCGESFILLTGDDLTCLDFMLQGGHGVISVVSNVAPKMMHDMCMAALNHNEQQAKMMDEKLIGLHRGLFFESNPIPAKWALHKMGFIQAGIRLPLTWLSDSHHEPLTEALKRAEIL